MKICNWKAESFLIKLDIIEFLKTQYEFDEFEIAYVLDSQPEIIEVYDRVLLKIRRAETSYCQDVTQKKI